MPESSPFNFAAKLVHLKAPLFNFAKLTLCLFNFKALHWFYAWKFLFNSAPLTLYLKVSFQLYNIGFMTQSFFKIDLIVWLESHCTGMSSHSFRCMELFLKKKHHHQYRNYAECSSFYKFFLNIQSNEIIPNPPAPSPIKYSQSENPRHQLNRPKRQVF